MRCTIFPSSVYVHLDLEYGSSKWHVSGTTGIYLPAQQQKKNKVCSSAQLNSFGSGLPLAFRRVELEYGDTKSGVVHVAVIFGLPINSNASNLAATTFSRNRSNLA